MGCRQNVSHSQEYTRAVVFVMKIGASLGKCLFGDLYCPGRLIPLQIPSAQHSIHWSLWSNIFNSIGKMSNFITICITTVIEVHFRRKITKSTQISPFLCYKRVFQIGLRKQPIVCVRYLFIEN